MARLLAAVVLAGLGGWGCGGSSEATKVPGPVIRGEGATFPAPLYGVWITRYAAQTGTRVSYRPRGSAKGIEALLKRQIDFAGSDSPLADHDMERAGDIVHIPMSAAAVAIIYNAEGVGNGLQLRPDVLTDIFLGTIKSWNDPRIAALNPGAYLPPKPITVIARRDGSGTTRILTEYLSRVSPLWREQVGTGMFVKWPVGLVAEGNQGVSDLVWKAPGTIGYCSLNFARAKRLKVAAIGHRGGYVAPSLDSTVAAASSAAATLPGDLRITLLAGATDDSYPITGFTYLLVRRELDDPAKANALADFIWWGLHDGQIFAPGLHFAPLPPDVVTRSVEQLRNLRVAGSPVFDTSDERRLASAGGLWGWFDGAP